MSVEWDALTMPPSVKAINELRAAWSWLLPDDYQPVLFSALGDLFYQTPSGEIWWLNTGTAEVSKLADSQSEFQRLLDTDKADEWLLPPLIEKLISAGKTLSPGRCYTFAILPIFREGTYAVENLNPVDAREHFGLTGHIHKEIPNLLDGATVEIKIVE
jgi:Domain of unknown function (DUF1851)